MKKCLVMVAAALMAVMSVNAQNGYDDTKHEVAIGFGALSNSQWIDVFEEIGTMMVGVTYKDEEFSGPFSAEYFYHVKNWLGVGGILAYGESKQDMYLSKNKIGELSHGYLTVMPAAKFDWLRKKNFGLYSKVAFGATMRSESIDCENKENVNAKDNDGDSEIHVNWQLSALGVEVGAPRLRGFLEIGAGEQGIVLLGVRAKF